MGASVLTPDLPAVAGVRIEIDGQVQGVGFRPWVHTLAQATAIRGRVWNHSRGVTIEAFGARDSLRAFVEQLERPPMPAARVRDVQCEPIPDEAVASFEIVASCSGLARRPSIPPDLATCDACRRELLDPTDRRYRYPFINCTRCGPRYTICLDVPYDRQRTTMAAFAMCEACRREYEDSQDRRFHAQPNACPDCGPRLRLVDAQGNCMPGEPIIVAARLLREGAILAVKGLGGYHLACDATRPDAVAMLRARKHRDEKPFAVMVPSLAFAERLAGLSPAERDLLVAPSRPIVLVARRPTSGLAEEVAPGNPLVGLMLPYTPLHELLLAEVGRPLVMTSGNRSDEPMICGDDEALRQLGGDIADFLLQHDRAIANRCDDSVARVVAGRPVVLRRSRGWVPGNLRVARRFPHPILASGAHLKNAFCLAADDLVWLGPHVGDLETHEACAAFEIAVERFQRFVGIEPEVVAHDLHPDYFTTRYATESQAALRVAVQHHHAHVASAMGEHRLDGPVIGLAWDGTGYGTDGTAWGGELLVATLADFRRLATFRPIRLAGGDRAIREVWRIALALLDDAFDGDPPLAYLPLFQSIDAKSIDVARQMIRNELHAPLAHGVGRYFDAFGAIVLGKSESRHEGQVAMQLTFAADPAERRAYPFEIEAGVVATVDLRPTVRCAVDDLLAGGSAATISGRFHATLVAAAVEMMRLAEREVGRLPVVLTGGCFQNARLVEDLMAALAPKFRVYVHEDVPPNDGGIALGQAMIAGARLRGERGGV
jgi:hydrogenase maturation protein HypF